MSGPDSQDVEMGEATASGAGSGVEESGKGHRDVHNTSTSNTNSNLNPNPNFNKGAGQQTDADALLPHTTLTFEVKQDLDEKSQDHCQSVPPPSSSPVSSSSKMKSSLSAAASKKKGTAATKKGPKKPSTTTTAAATATTTTTSSSISKAPKTKRGAKTMMMMKKKKTGGPTAAKRENGELGEGSSGDDDETDNGPYCLCRGPDDHRWMIGCDVCEDWFHGECVALDKETGEGLVERFVCPNCTDGRRHYTKYKKTCALAGCRRPARLYADDSDPRHHSSVFCGQDHCDAWWAAAIATLPTRAASQKAMEVLTQEDFVGLLASTAAAQGGWKLGDKPFGNIEGLWANGLPTRPDVLSDEEQAFLQASAAERLALGNEIVQYKKMLQLLDWANQRRQAAIEAGRFTKESCGYDARLDTVSVRHQFAAWLDSPEGQATFKSGKLDVPLASSSSLLLTSADGMVVDGGGSDAATGGMCEKKRCKPHAGWYKILTSEVRVLIKETATAAADKLDAEEVVRCEAEVRYERRQLEKNWVEVLDPEGL
ncbi:hypothetical protein SLS62_007599 [Diatrype stigma]|uniref:PHD-type domain-containing protein n=1 Tax=Diatrype stigma TaxID=117547 RepID=A0AAN9YN87_9PEZI